MKLGRIIPDSAGDAIEVEYDLWVRESDAAGGRIHIAGDPLPGLQFTAPSPSTCTLETENGAAIRIAFNNPNGDFECPAPDEAKSVLAGEA